MRKTPYTELGIKRLKCFRCDNKASFQWNICADGNIFRPICLQCDIELNKVVLKFMKFPDWEEKYNNYKKKLKISTKAHHFLKLINYQIIKQPTLKKI